MQIENWVDGALQHGVVGDHLHRVAAVARVASLVDHQAHHRAVMIIGDHRQVGVDGIARRRPAVESLARVAVHPPRQAAAVIGGANHPLLGDGANRRRHHHLERVARAEAAQASLESLVDHRLAHHGLTICGAHLHHGDIHQAHRLESLVRVEAESQANRQALLLEILGVSHGADGVISHVIAHHHHQESLASLVDHQVRLLMTVTVDGVSHHGASHQAPVAVESQVRAKVPRVAHQAVVSGYG